MRYSFELLFILCIIIGVVHPKSSNNADSCDVCMTYVPVDFEIRSDYFMEDFSKFSDTLYDLCSILNDGMEAIEECAKTADSYLIALEQQKYHGHSFYYTSRQTCQIISFCAVDCCTTQLPEQVHISLTSDPSEIQVMWVSSVFLSNPEVKYYQSGFDNTEQLTVTAIQSTYTDGGWVGNIYTAVLTNLKPLSSYFYQVSGETDGTSFYSRSFQFLSAPSLSTSSSSDVQYVRRNLLHIGDKELFNEPVFEAKKKHNNNINDGEASPLVIGSPVIALFADMDTSSNGNETAQSLATLASNDTINLIVHSGDISYADSDETIWDEYFRMIEPFASHVPYMTAPGNHENYYNFSAYYSRLNMPVEASGSTSKQYYSFNYQNIHFVSWSVEEYNGTDLLPGNPQYDWLINDLTVANQNRDAQPWIILFGHRPLYCSTDSVDCTEYAFYWRYLIEDIVNQYHVDVVIQAHKHNYERTYPVYKGKVMSTSYEDPSAPVYFVVGTGGKSKDDSWLDPLPDWSVSQVDKYGYMLLSAPDAYTLETVFISKSYNPYDNVTITRSSTFW